ncbi:MAG: c-type cytochrome [Leptospiraceae bacterium]|nr:c-type cytochrome [Leptospiraceae bacterium]MCB1306099.1 c-type cytochrome [Leptospiraceae bacterium]
MLSKSQAKAFFLGGTVLFSAIFLGLTYDAHRQAADRTNEAELTDSVIRGKKIWEDKNCMGCHTILGEGAYYAPDLTKVVENRGEEWIRVFIKDPEAMFPGERKMVKYDFTEDQITDIIAFLRWVGKIDTNGWPPKPNIPIKTVPGTKVVDTTTTSTVPPPKKFQSLCVACHAVNGKGGNVGPALDGVASRFDRPYLVKWLHNPQEVKPGTAMPKLPLTDQEIEQIVDFLMTLK